MQAKLNTIAAGGADTLPRPTKVFAYGRLNMLCCREDPRTHERIPFSCRYVTRQGEVIVLSNIVTTSIDTQRGTRRVRLVGTAEDGNVKNAQTRTLRDCCILQVDEWRIKKT